MKEFQIQYNICLILYTDIIHTGNEQSVWRKFCLYILFYIDFITVILHATEIRTANLEEIIKLFI